MVSGLVTSPDDQSRICLLEASPIRIASNSLMSIKCFSTPLVFDLEIREVGHVSNRADLLFCFCLGRVGAVRELDVVEVVEHLVGREGNLPVAVETLCAFLDFLRRGLTRGCAQRAR